MPIVYASDIGRSEAFYRLLGLDVRQRARSGAWLELGSGSAVLGLHVAAQGRDARLDLAFVADEPLEDVADRLHQNGVEQEDTITDEEFGRSLRVRDPDGLLIQINEHDAELYI